MSHNKRKIISERCQRLCEQDKDCFANNRKQITCISDMVINKMWPVKELIEFAKAENQCELLVEPLSMASDSINELIAWIKFLHLK